MKLAPYPEYKESASPAAPKIPDQWTVHRCRYLFREVDERSKDGQEAHLSMSQKYGLIDSSKIDKWRLQSESYAGGKLCKDGDLVLNRLKAHLGVFAHAKQSGVVSPDYTVLRPITDDSTRFLEFLFKSPPFITEFTKSTKGIVKGFWRLYTDDFYSIRAVVPPPEEQRQILRFIDSLTTRANKFIRNKRRLIELLKEQKQNVINQAVTRGLDPKVKFKPSGVEWIGDIPEHWNCRKLLYASALIVDGTHFSPSNSETGDFLYITAKNIREGGVNLQNATYIKAKDHVPIYDRCPVSKGDVLYIKDGATAGIACVNQLEMEFSLLSSVALIKPKNGTITAEYLVYLLNCQMLKSFVLRKLVGGAMTRFTIELIKRFPVIFPPLDEQLEIVGSIERLLVPIDLAITRAEREIELMREYRTRLISDVVTGQVDVRGIEVPEVAEDELLALEEDSADGDDVIDAEGDMNETD